MVDFNFSAAAETLSNEISTLDARAALRRIMEARKGGNISDKELVMLCPPTLLNSILFSSIDPTVFIEETLIKGAVGSPGAVCGKVARTVAEADHYIETGEPFILVLPETNAKLVRYIEKAAGVVTFHGGITSHAAIITRQKGIPAIIGCGDLDLNSGEEITIDGAAGIIMRGAKPIIPAEPENPDLAALLDIADNVDSHKTHHMVVEANADTPEDAAKARALGAKGIGAARTEHMFFAQDRLPHMQALIMAADDVERQKELDALFEMQKQDFKAMLKIMDGLPVTIRLLDAPLHEFMPQDADEITALAETLGVSDTEIAQRAEDLRESNPMLGKRAVRLGVLHPEIYEMQARAILQAATELEAEGYHPEAQIMIPLVSETGEMEQVKQTIAQAEKAVKEKFDGQCASCKIGMMAEVPAACLNAKEFAKQSAFFSFGTNDLTQTTLGLSRDDTSEVTTHYQQTGIYKTDPFQTLHPQVARLVQLGIHEGKQANAELMAVACGEHAGDPASIRQFQRMGMDALSVSPPRIPIARLAAAQAMIGYERELGSWKGRETGSKVWNATL